MNNAGCTTWHVCMYAHHMGTSIKSSSHTTLRPPSVDGLLIAHHVQPRSRGDDSISAVPTQFFPLNNLSHSQSQQLDTYRLHSLPPTSGPTLSQKRKFYYYYFRIKKKKGEKRGNQRNTKNTHKTRSFLGAYDNLLGQRTGKKKNACKQ